MKRYDFDEIIERRGTDSLKYGILNEIFGTSDLKPLWVADMDFRTPDFIIEAIEKRLKHPVLGYWNYWDGYHESIMWWAKTRYDWAIEKDWILFSPGIVPALGLCVMAYTQKGDDVLVQSPVYHPFYYAIESQERNIVYNPLKLVGERYEMDLEDLEIKLRKGVKMMFLCNPHNPVARCWERDVLARVAFLCKKYGCILVSDEIHADLTMPSFVHNPTHLCAQTDEEKANIITLMAPSKTFNMAGLATSEVIISDLGLRKKFIHLTHNVLHMFNGNTLGAYALEAAYSPLGAEWVDQLRDYIWENISSMNDFLRANFPMVKTFRHEATYLPWLDFSAYGYSHEELLHKLAFECGLGLNDGKIFGKEADNKMRINVALPKKELLLRLEGLKHL
ncbi:MAG: PatB family C-S lyase [Bacteroidales bacterium]|jgi:cystathionine beta-lyase|nr:PatB family C-S lyase [Bacteroidales bacterium]MDD4702724.1 PatB family C-S lyase [Bacteroidales bacterium]